MRYVEHPAHRETWSWKEEEKDAFPSPNLTPITSWRDVKKGSTNPPSLASTTPSLASLTAELNSLEVEGEVGALVEKMRRIIRFIRRLQEEERQAGGVGRVEVWRDVEDFGEESRKGGGEGEVEVWRDVEGLEDAWKEEGEEGVWKDAEGWGEGWRDDIQGADSLVDVQHTGADTSSWWQEDLSTSGREEEVVLEEQVVGDVHPYTFTMADAILDLPSAYTKDGRGSSHGLYKNGRGVSPSLYIKGGGTSQGLYSQEDYYEIASLGGRRVAGRRKGQARKWEEGKKGKVTNNDEELRLRTGQWVEGRLEESIYQAWLKTPPVFLSLVSNML